MAAPRIKLYSMMICPFAQRTRMHLDLLGLPYELENLDICSPRPDWFLKLNPAGQVPVIEFDGDVVSDSLIIAEYLQEVAPKPLPFGRTPAKRAAIRALIKYVESEFIPALYILMAARAAEERAQREANALATWRRLDEFVREHDEVGPFMDGEIGMAEVALAPFVLRYEVVRHYQGFELPAGDGFEHVARWRDAMLADPVVQATAESVPDLIKLYEDYTLGHFNGSVPPGKERSSLDLSVPLASRPIPQPLY